jgi:hypothetical protein
MRAVLVSMLLLLPGIASGQFVPIPVTGTGGTSTGSGRPPAILPSGDVFLINAWDYAEIYRVQTRTFEFAGVVPVHLLDGVATLALSDGRAIVSGGGNSNIDVRNFMLVWNPEDRSFRQITGMLSARRNHAMLQLDHDRVLIVGGEGAAANYEIYDLGQERTVTSGTLPVTLNLALTMRHPSGKVVFIGGTEAVIFDATTATFVAGHGIPASTGGGAAIEMLADGRILVTGGIAPGGPSVRGTTTALLFDPFTGAQESVGSMHNMRFYHAATRLPSGKVLITGGSDECSGRCKPALAPAELFDPQTKTFSSTGGMNFPRLYHVPVKLLSHDVLFVGGDNGTDDLPKPELYVAEGSAFQKHRAARH